MTSLRIVRNIGHKNCHSRTLKTIRFTFQEDIEWPQCCWLLMLTIILMPAGDGDDDDDDDADADDNDDEQDPEGGLNS